MGDYVYFRFTGKLKKEFGEKYEWARPFTHNERDVPYPEEIPFMSLSAYNQEKKL